MSSNTVDISAIPAVDQHVLHNGTEYTTVKEGLAYILIPVTASTTPQTTPKGGNQAQSVFYNPIQQFNRDLSVLAIKAYGEGTLARKQRDVGAAREKFKAKMKEKKLKRKREVGLTEEARKSAKLDDGEPGVTSKAIREQSDLQEDGRDVQGIMAEDIVGADSQTMKPNHAAKNSETQFSKEASEPEAVDSPDVTTQVQSPQIPPIPDAAQVLEPAGQKDGNQQATVSLTSPSNGDQTQKHGVPTFTILDALSATGLRALRYAHEIPFTTSVTANDLLATATKMINTNVKHNKLEDKIKSVTGNALTHMYSLVGDSCQNERGQKIPSRKYDVIDLDPYGTAVPFLDAAVQSVRDDGGLLCVTCTDAGVWASNGYPEKAYSLYGGIPIKGMHSHEGGLRLILNSIATSAARYGLAMEPLLSLSIDFYARVFVRIHKSAADVKFLAGKTMIVYNCDQGCGAWTTQMVARNKLAQNKSGNGYFWKHVFAAGPSVDEKCTHCGTPMHVAGPMYAGPLHSPEFIKRILDGLPNVSKDTYQTSDRIEGMLNMALEETLPPREEDDNSPTLTSKTNRYDPAVLDHYPFFFIPSVLAKIVHCITPHENALRGALRHLGYRVTRSHTKPGSIKTDAPWDVIWEVMREWTKQKAPVKDGAIKKGTAGWNIMRLGEKNVQEKDIKAGDAQGKDDALSNVRSAPDIVFDEKLGREHDAKKLVRYQVNPRENWGPMNRAKGHA